MQSNIRPEAMRSVYNGPIHAEHLVQINELNKQATACKNDGDWSGAIAALREAKQLSGKWYRDTKLALYLQQAGQFSASMREFDWLLKNSLTVSKRLFGHNPTSVVMAQHASWCARVHAKAALAAKREKNTDMEQHHTQKAEQYAALNSKLKTISDAEQRAKRKEYEQARTAGNEAMTAFLRKYKRL